MRTVRRAHGFLLSFCFLLCFCGLNGCAHTVSDEFRQQVSAPIPFQALLEKGEAYKGEKVILGGYVLEVLNEPGSSLLNILQAPLDVQEKPKSADLSQGRFLVRTDKFLDPEVFSEGRRVTVGGSVAGVQQRRIGNGTYEYPVIEAEELHLLPKKPPRARHPYPYYWHSPWYPYPWHWPWYPYW